MTRRINKFPRRKRILGKDLDLLIDQVNSGGNVYASGRNVRVSRSPLGTHINFIDTGGGGSDAYFLAKVIDSDAAGGGIYSCKACEMDSDLWKYMYSEGADAIKVFNIPEADFTTYNLAPSDIILVMFEEADPDMLVYWDYSGIQTKGNSPTRRAQALEGSQADGRLSIKLTDTNGAAAGAAINAYAFPSKAATDYTNYLPDIDANDYVIVMQDLEGDWILVNPTLINMGSKTDAVTATAETIGGRFLSKWIEEW